MYCIFILLFHSGKLGTIGQITVCKCKWDPSRTLLLANTHLFYHPAAGFARVLQTDAIVRTLKCVRDHIEIKGIENLSFLVIDGEEEHEDDGVERYPHTHSHTQITEKIKPEEIKSEKIKTEKIKTDELKIEDNEDINTGNRGSHRGSERGSEVLSVPVQNHPVPIVCTLFMGDFNSTPETAVIEYFHR